MVATSANDPKRTSKVGGPVTATTGQGFAAFERAGGKGEFFEFDVPGGRNGHALNAYPELWIPYIEKFMATLQAAERK